MEPDPAWGLATTLWSGGDVGEKRHENPLQNAFKLNTGKARDCVWRKRERDRGPGEHFLEIDGYMAHTLENFVRRTSLCRLNFGPGVLQDVQRSKGTSWISRSYYPSRFWLHSDEPVTCIGLL